MTYTMFTQEDEERLIDGLGQDMEFHALHRGMTLERIAQSIRGQDFRGMVYARDIIDMMLEEGPRIHGNADYAPLERQWPVCQCPMCHFLKVLILKVAHGRFTDDQLRGMLPWLDPQTQKTQPAPVENEEKRC